MTRVNAKPPANASPAADYFARLSKAALVDILVDCLVRQNGEDQPLTTTAAAALAEPVLRMRGDRLPRH
jgi:hypothetical protein